MNWQELKREADKLSVSDRLKLVEAIVRAINNDINPRPPIPDDIIERMTGLAKTNNSPLTGTQTRPAIPPGTLTDLRGLLKKDNLPPSDQEIEAMLQERREEKYK
ncbi:hypothetical protein ACE1CI_11440 [Aerosakkonemataceae cyanobacterium BLCC-F50]|uniref:Uncharacterized protein n=1 Tax=Floridaenema flaviceps BLCC-F50 TaxID=3153642 RepID=A0ABV4XP71_9CYAN